MAVRPHQAGQPLVSLTHPLANIIRNSNQRTSIIPSLLADLLLLSGLLAYLSPGSGELCRPCLTGAASTASPPHSSSRMSHWKCRKVCPA